ncbi:MFS transporter, DHA2 family, multidrug resistance protein [Filimonas lacunae]|uniref:MFS transporter, DHA2 family, multidrug resistance protein n=1 Tax=Filimonas lacunae TaxID=477680 RepID=A0A173MPB7_9BACT|nr:DHA2 family efflux MFS transporter permease subunit [Filimonas lacunae]BAV09280.1 inner membrane component of tripartite multidrug resistance system [Filimonas lacunae]SIS70378.1 MFS transporter, DHA2 family, multidrug resistance protein [Filimonas lacunae]
MLEQNSLVEYGARRVIITITAVFCALLEIIDTTIVNVALNDMKGSLGATLNEVSWVVTAYAIANVIIVPMTSWLSQQFGRTNYFAASVILFTVSSFLCGNSSTMSELIIFRFLQGLGGGALLVTSQTIITEIYPVEKRPMAQAIYTLGIIVGPTLGPPLGGYIIDHYSWPLIFYINIPVGIIATLLTLMYVKSPKYAEKRKASEVDWLGIGLLMATVGSLQYVLEKGQEEDWFSNTGIVVLTVTAILGGFFFIWRELVFKYPVVELRVLKNTNLRIGVILSFIMGFGLYGSTFVVPLYTQSILGWTAFQSGMLMVPSTLVVAFMMPIVGQMIQKGVSQKGLIALGLFIFFLYCFFTHGIMTPATGGDNFFWVLMLRGLGLGFLAVPVSVMSLSTLKGQQIGQGAAFSGMMRQLGGSFGVAMISTYISRQNMKHRSDLVSKLNIYDPNVQNRLQALKAGMIAKGKAPNIAEKTALQMIDGSISVQSTILSYMDVFIGIGIMFLITVPLVIIFVKRSKNKVSLADAGGH